MAGLFDFGDRASEESLHSAGAVGGFLHEDAKLRDTPKLKPNAFDLTRSDFYTDDGEGDNLDMSSFFREHDALRMETEEMHSLREFDPGMIVESEGQVIEKEDVQQNESTDKVPQNTIDAPESVDSVVMGIPYYVACQWQQMQQQQQQQHQAVMMLWWQAYLSGAYNTCGPKGMTPTTQLGWSLPSAGLTAFHGAYANFGDDALYQHMLMLDDKGCASHHVPKRRRKNDAIGNLNGIKKGRRQRHDERVRSSSLANLNLCL